jgi:ankyrin repeat protein
MKSNSHISNTDECHGKESCNHTVVREIDQTPDEIKFENSIYNACVIGDMEKVRLLTNKHGTSILKEQDKSGYSGLHYAARNSHYEICEFLIKNQVDVNIKTFGCESTALHRAAYIGNEKIVKLLLDNNASPKEIDCDGKTALHKCVEQYLKTNSKKFEKTIEILLNYDSSLLDIKDKIDKNPLDYFPDLKNFIT